jgi:hypothetical protein
MTVLLVTVVSAIMVPAAAVAAPLRRRLGPTVACQQTGGATLEFTLTNRGSHEQRLSSDLHLTLDAVRAHGRKTVLTVFVFPMFGFDTVPAHGDRAFIVPFGVAVPEAQEPGVDLSARRLILRAEVFLAGWDRAIKRSFSFAGC